MNIINFIFGFKGRTSRAYFALLLPIFAVIQAVVAFLSIPVSDVLRYSRVTPTDLLIIFAVFTLYFWLKYAYVAKRAHDFNKKALESRLVNVMFILDIVSVISIFIFKNSGLVIPCFIVSLICLIALAFKKGNEEENNFGKPQVPFWKKNRGK